MNAARVIAAALLFIAAQALAQRFPSQAVKLLVGVPPGAVIARLATQGLELVGNTPAAFDAFIRAEIDKWSAVLKAAGIKPAT